MKLILGIAAFAGLLGHCQEQQVGDEASPLVVPAPSYYLRHFHYYFPDAGAANGGSSVGPKAGAAAPTGGSHAGSSGPTAGAGGSIAHPAGSGGHAAGSSAGSSNQAGSAAPSVMSCSKLELFSDTSCSKIATGLSAYRPQYELWSDGAHKDRYIYLPPNAHIDTSNPDRWNFPEGTRIYKTFSVNGKKIETRVIEKVEPDASFASWIFTAYAWQPDQVSIIAAPAGETNWLNSGHDIPDATQCKTCHTMQGLDAVNGFGAIQLNHAEDGSLTLKQLLSRNLLVNGTGGALNVSLTNSTIPGDAVTQAGLGYLHANCGSCHGGLMPRANMKLWSTVGTSSLADTELMKTASCECLQLWTGRRNKSGVPYTLRIAPGHSAVSGVIGRMHVRGAGEQMPPLGTNVVDDTGVAAVSAMIDALSSDSCDAKPPVCTTPTN
jgi:hypothetical protein